uniref:KIB1-4 beta-propeller domain-containing protein n=1 Tax=Leersia perrieri TaxID=77586 RepID=A0A0D9XT07_9ORYZ
MIPCSKRRRRRLTPSDAAAAGGGGKNKMPSPDWSSLDGDLLDLIGQRVLAAGDLDDYVRLRAVCTHWAASTATPRGRGVADPRFHPRQWMMLPEGHGLYPGHPSLGGHLRFLNLSTGVIVTSPHLPLLLSDDHVILDSVDGLLLLHRDADTAIRLLNPFTGDVTDLPPLDSLLPYIKPIGFRLRTDRSKRSALMQVRAAVAVAGGGVITVMLAFITLDRVAFAAAGDKRWTFSEYKLKHFLKPTSFQGKIYALQFTSFEINKMYIYQFNQPYDKGGLLHLDLPVKIGEAPMDKFIYLLNFAVCGSELLIVAYNGASPSKLLVYRVADLVNGKMEPVTSIGDHTLFINERCVCVSLSNNKEGISKSLPSILHYSIICMHTLQVPASVDIARFEQYDLGTSIWSPASDGDIFQAPPPSPHTLIHHIFTCCSHRYWNKGIMYCSKTDPSWLVKQDLRIGA